MLAALAAMALSALAVSSASAAIVPAKFSSSQFKMSTAGITVKKNGAEAKTCTLPAELQGWVEGSTFLVSSAAGLEPKFSCIGGGYLTMWMFGEAKFDTVTGSYFLKVFDYSEHSLTSPWEGYWQKTGGVGTSPAWANGSGATASTVTFSNAYIGNTFGGQKVTIDGTFKVTNWTGGLVTLSH
jgi:hypothetical protein